MSKPCIVRPQLFSVAAAVILMGTPIATAQELPSYEASGFPISPAQLSVLNTAHVQERSPTATLTVAGMPASPSQVKILGIHEHVAANGTAKTDLRPDTLQVEGRLRRVESAAMAE